MDSSSSESQAKFYRFLALIITFGYLTVGTNKPLSFCARFTVISMSLPRGDHSILFRDEFP